MSANEPTPGQHVAISELNDKWGVARWDCNPDGTMTVELDDGDEVIVSEEGEYDAD